MVACRKFKLQRELQGAFCPIPPLKWEELNKGNFSSNMQTYKLDSTPIKIFLAEICLYICCDMFPRTMINITAYLRSVSVTRRSQRKSLAKYSPRKVINIPEYLRLISLAPQTKRRTLSSQLATVTIERESRTTSQVIG